MIGIAISIADQKFEDAKIMRHALQYWLIRQGTGLVEQYLENKKSLRVSNLTDIIDDIVFELYNKPALFFDDDNLLYKTPIQHFCQIAKYISSDNYGRKNPRNM